MTDEIEGITDAELKIVEERSKKRRERDLADLKKVLTFVEGRRFVWRLLSEAGIFRSSFNSNALSMAFSEGNRNLGLTFLMEIMQATPETFTRMQRESVSDKRSEERGQA